MALVFGCRGALGKSLFTRFALSNKASRGIDRNGSGFSVYSLPDHHETDMSNTSQLIDSLGNSASFDAVICTAGGWSGGYISDSSIIEQGLNMFQVNALSALSASHIASKVLKPKGLLAFVGALPVYESPTPDMIAYSMSKASVHHLALNLMADLNFQGRVVCLLPVTLDTPMNRKFMPDADHSAWTPLDVIGDQIEQWTMNESLTNGGFYSVVTRDGITEFELKQ